MIAMSNVVAAESALGTASTGCADIPESPQFKLRPAESTTDGAQPSAESDSAGPDATSSSVPQTDAEANATPQDIFLMLNAVQQLHQQGQQSQANPGAGSHNDAPEEATPGSPTQQGTPPPLQDLQLDPALMGGSGVPAGQQPPGVPPQQQHLSQQPPHPHIPHPHHPHMHHQSLIYHHPPPQYIPSGYPPPGGHTMPPLLSSSSFPNSLYVQLVLVALDASSGGFTPSSGPAEEAAPAQPASVAKKAANGLHKTQSIGNASERIIIKKLNVDEGAILTRVQYIHDLKENEARNIEKWTLEKLLMDQAMGDLQAQLDEMRQRLEEERQKREQVEAQLAEVLRIQQERAGEEPSAKRARVE
ncbi:helix loop helix domain [Rhizoctonia solani]|uniref:Helix loop helix domain n=1 Tax=Rhizoctonia solani TaxID=456999 RepID=A0A8H7IF13_9AGAM|nr:helix loop helix domain [Rhizoctonia solani]